MFNTHKDMAHGKLTIFHQLFRASSFNILCPNVYLALSSNLTETSGTSHYQAVLIPLESLFIIYLFFFFSGTFRNCCKSH